MMHMFQALQLAVCEWRPLGTYKWRASCWTFRPEYNPFRTPHYALIRTQLQGGKQTYRDIWLLFVQHPTSIGQPDPPGFIMRVRGRSKVFRGALHGFPFAEQLGKRDALMLYLARGAEKPRRETEFAYILHVYRSGAHLRRPRGVPAENVYRAAWYMQPPLRNLICALASFQHRIFSIVAFAHEISISTLIR
jgi:hypothetical protein